MPYSDNLYSMDPVGDEGSDAEPIDSLGPESERREPETRGWQGGAEDEGEDELLYSPTDGYFGGNTSSSSTYHPSVPAPASSTASSARIPRVPNVWVRDPSLDPGSTAESKAQEAREEALNNQGPDLFARPSSRPYSTQYPASSSRATHHPPSSVAYTPSTAATSSTTPFTGPYFYTQPPHSPHEQGYYIPNPTIVPREAPPAYTPSRSAPSNSSSSPAATAAPSTSHASPVADDSPRNYNTFHFSSTTMGREEARGLLAEHPESMGNPDEEYVGPIPAWRERVKRRVPWLGRRGCGIFLLGAVLIVVLLALLISSATSKSDKLTTPPKEDPSLGQPVNERPPVSNNPSDGSPSNGTPGGDPLDGGDFPWPPVHTCKDGKTSQDSTSFDLAFGQGHNLTIIQDIKKIDNNHGRSVHVSGDLTIRRSGEGTPGPSVVVDVVANLEGIEPEIRFRPEYQALIITVPSVVPWDEAHTYPCLKIQATVWVPEDAVLDTLSAETVHLSIKLRDDLTLHVRRGADLATIVGDVAAATDGLGQTVPLEDGAPSGYRFDSRWTQVRTTSAPITGHWPLYDFLRLQTTSGDIRVGIEPQAVDPDAPEPALLYVKSMSGDVELYQPVDKVVAAPAGQKAAAADKSIPPRDYRSDVYTTSGSVKASLAAGMAFKAHSTSGRLEVDVLPVLDVSLAESGETASVETSSTSGPTIFRVLAPLWTEDKFGRYSVGGGSSKKALRVLQSRHSSTSADIQLRYPKVWEGELDFSSMTGSLRAGGEGVRVIKKGSDWPGVNKKLVAEKGPGGGSQIMGKSTTGDIDATVE